MAIRIVADDLTGALDAAAPFAAAEGPLPVLWDQDRARASAGSFVLDTESRGARSRPDRWVSLFQGADLAVKKIDSLLRGRTLAEIVSCLAHGGFTSAVIAPAFPAQQRITRGGRQYWRRTARDPWRRVERDLLAGLTAQGLPIRHAATAAAISGRGYFMCDAITDQDLGAVVAAGRRLAPPVLWCGCAGLTHALVGHTPALAGAPPAPLLVVVGSHHQVTLGQIEALGADDPARLVRIDPRADLAAGEARLAALLGRAESAALVIDLPDKTGAKAAGPLFDRVFEQVRDRLPRPGAAVVTGGSTLFRLLHNLGAASLTVLGELMPGVPMARVTGGAWDGVTVISKSGAFGAPDLLIRLIESAKPVES